MAGNGRFCGGHIVCDRLQVGSAADGAIDGAAIDGAIDAAAARLLPNEPV